MQVKPVDEASSSSTCGIDLHYDKDEALAESFGLGSFPTLSTVTYLTGASSKAPPTILLDHTYTQGEEEVMSLSEVIRWWHDDYWTWYGSQLVPKLIILQNLTRAYT